MRKIKKIKWTGIRVTGKCNPIIERVLKPNLHLHVKWKLCYNLGQIVHQLEWCFLVVICITHRLAVGGLCFTVPLYCLFCWNTPNMSSSHWKCSPQYRPENSDKETDVNKTVHRNYEENGQMLLIWHEVRADIWVFYSFMYLLGPCTVININFTIWCIVPELAYSSFSSAVP